MNGTESQATAATRPWQEENEHYLQLQMQSLRTLLARRVLWLRQRWGQTPMPNYPGLIITDAQVDWLLLGDERQAEERFYREDPQAAALGRTLAAQEQELAELSLALTESGVPPALEVLADLFGLTSFEKKVILLCLAPALDLSFELLYAYVQDEVQRKNPTPYLALAVFSGPDQDLSARRRSFMPQANLRRFRLVELEYSPTPSLCWGAAPLSLDERLINFLLGFNQTDSRIDSLLKPLRAPLLTSEHQDLVAQLTALLEASGGLPVLNLTGPAGAGKRAVAWALGRRLGLELRQLNVSLLPPPGPERQGSLRLMEREAILNRLAYYVDADVLEPAGGLVLEEIIQRLAAFVIVGSRERWRTEEYILPVPVAKPDARAQILLWRQALEGVRHTLDGDLEGLVQQFDFGPQAIAQVVSAARGRGRLNSQTDEPSLSRDDLWHSCREHAATHLGELAQRLTPCYQWEDIILPEDILRQLQEITTQVAHRGWVYENWGFGAKLSRGRGISALFSGPSGTGKTMAAEILAGHLGLDLYRIDLAGVVSKYIGETEKNLKKVFEAAEASGAILFFDEADALFGKRTEVKDSHDRYANIEVNYLLQRMEDYRGLAILATNRSSALDRAFLRRLRFLVEFPFPDWETRRRIWQKVLPPQAEVDGLDFGPLARMEISGGNIRNIALNAAFLAAGEGGSICMNRIMRAARREYAKIDKLITEAEFGRHYSQTKPG